MKFWATWVLADWLVFGMILLELGAMVGYCTSKEYKVAVYWALCAGIGINMLWK